MSSLETSSVNSFCNFVYEHGMIKIEININQCTVTMSTFIKVTPGVPYLLTSSDIKSHGFRAVLSSSPALPQYSRSLNAFILLGPHPITFIIRKTEGVFGL